MSGDQCALDPHGNLLDASQIDWYYDPDNAGPLPRTAPPPATMLPAGNTSEAAPAPREG